MQRRLKEPVLPLTGEAATRLYQQAGSKCENPCSAESSGCRVSELVLTCASTSRDFHKPKGPDGFVLRVTPLDGHYQTVQTAADMTIILHGAKGDQAERGRPLRVWHVPASELADYWMPSRLLNGFLFRLEWVREIPPGDYILSVIYERQEKTETQTICREVFFQDQSPRR